MAQKLGNGGEGLEEYDTSTGKYVEDGKPNSSYDNPNEKTDKLFSFDSGAKKGKLFGETRPALEPWGGVNSYAEYYEITSDDNKVAKYNAVALQLIKEETGLSDEDSEELFNSFDTYFFGWGKATSLDFERISKGLHLMGSYQGTIYRGMEVESENPEYEDELEYIKNMKIGDDFKFKRISSWSSSESVANDFAGNDKRRADVEYVNRIKFICKNNKNGVSVSHISHFGNYESEVLVPNDAKYKVVGKKSKKRYSSYYEDYLYDMVIELEEV